MRQRMTVVYAWLTIDRWMPPRTAPGWNWSATCDTTRSVATRREIVQWNPLLHESYRSLRC